MVDNLGRFKKGHIPWSKGKKCPSISKAKKGIKFSIEHREKLSKARIGKAPWNKGKKCPQLAGKNHPCWKGPSEERTLRERNLRRKYKYNKKQAGRLSIETIQLVYENNIKKYGTLTCYLCLEPIKFGKDCLEHKQPLSRNGTNEYNNLAVACQRCNNKKYNKTEEEYRKEITKL